MSRPRRRALGSLLVTVCVVAVLGAGCSRGSSSTSTTTTTVRTGPPSVRVVGDGVASSAAAGVAATTGSTDVVDRSVARSRAVSWLDLQDPARPDEGSNHAALATTVREAPSYVLVSLGAGDTSAPDVVDPLLRQRVMAVVFDVLAHTVDTRVIVVGSGAAADREVAAAVAAVGEAGASWADRVAFASSAAEAASIPGQRGWV